MFYNRPAVRNKYLYELSALLQAGAGRVPTGASVVEGTKVLRDAAYKAASGRLDKYKDTFIDGIKKDLEGLPAVSRFRIPEFLLGPANALSDAFDRMYDLDHFMYGLPPATRQFYTGYRDATQASGFVRKAFEEFRVRLEYWRRR